MLEDSARARREEEARQGRIREGTERIDSNFSQFDNGFYDGFKGSYMDYYQPQLDDQFGKANDQLTYALARAGTLNSSMAADGRGDLGGQYDDARAGVVSEATAATNNLRGRVQGERSTLVSQLNATGDSARAANEANAASQRLFQEQPRYNPLGDIFSGVGQGIGAVRYGQQQDALWDRYRSGSTGTSTSGSTRIVN